MEKRVEKRRIVLVPLPLLGHFTPMMQLGQALILKGFSIIVPQGEFNRVNSSQKFPGFQFITIPDSELEANGPVGSLTQLNKIMEASFKDCIRQLLKQQGNDIACIIYDEFMYFCGAVAEELKLPNFIFSTQTATHKVCCNVLSKLNAKKYLIDMEEHDVQNKVVENMHPLRYKDLPTATFGELEPFLELCRDVVNKRTASAVIINTVTCLESSSLTRLQQELQIPVYPLGPLHITASSTGFSVLQEDRSCVEWLNKQKPRSVIYISSEGIESLPEEVSKMVLEKGYIVKWAPQIEVLGHPSVGGFWSHCGWNSTVESIVEGVPMICRPYQGEQMLNAIYLESVWRIGIQVGGELERGAVERAVKRLIVDKEGASMRERTLVLKEKLKASIRGGGSSCNALDELVKHLKTE
ncbi:unnamed protein product [Arabidopsis thaliana]|uniref:Glycosyltransferase n=1 Tax=Arabidopsis thaliana TaxID=3702 RepID=A0A654FDJ8_ARATH|nr:unnamed protein product [Arabidopsis thaliana]